MSISQRLFVIKILLAITAIYSFAIAFIAHLFFTKTYMVDIMGFITYQDSLVKLICIIGLLLALLAYYALRDPLRNRDMIKMLIITGVSIGAVSLYLINFGDFPATMYVNAISMLFLSGFLFFLYPWNETA